MRCATRPGGCCGTATTPRPPTWRPRCADWSTTSMLDAGGRAAGRGMYGFAGPAGAAPPTGPAARRPTLAVVGAGARRPVSCWNARRRITTSPTWSSRIGYRELNYGAVPDGKPLDPAVAVSRSRHRHNGIRRRAVRSRRGDAEVHLADSGDLRRPRSDHPACGGAPDRVADPRLGAGRTCRPPGTASSTLRERAALRDRQGRLRRRDLELPARAQPNWIRRRPDLGVRLWSGAIAAAAAAGVGGARRGSARRASGHYFMKPIVV